MSIPDVQHAGRTTPRLPELEPGIQLLDADADTQHVMPALAVDHVLLAGGTGCWIDPGPYAQTAALTDVAPSDRILDRFRVARGFTAFQHLALLEELPAMLRRETAVVIVPRFDQHYRDCELLADEGREMLLSGIAILARVARERDIPVLVTRQQADEFSAPLANAATRRIRCEATRVGPRFHVTDDETDTLVYPVEGHGELVQTTLAFWAEVLAARHTSNTDTPVGTEVTVRGAD